jgi:hypothetical protein
MKTTITRAMLVATAAFAVPMAISPAMAGKNTVSGSYGELNWSATSTLVGATRTQGGIGETPYTGSMPAYSGTVGLLMGGFVCSGTLLSDRRTILTAGHCVSDGFGVNETPDNGVTVFFRDPASGPDVQLYYGGPGYTTIQSSDVIVNGGYTGDVIDHNDIALVRLSEAAPDFAESYELYTGELTGLVSNITGYGSTSIAGGAMGVDTVNPNRLGWFRQGLNEYDYALGNAAFGTDWADILGEPFSQIEYSYISDFDNGLAANDATCVVSIAIIGAAGAGFCDLGTGTREVGVAGGDSGGGSFINGQVASVNSYGLTFGTGFGDFRSGLNSSWGEFSGYVPVWLHADWINRNLVAPPPAVPEPATWLMLIGGFALVGASMRRRKTAVSFA